MGNSTALCPPGRGPHFPPRTCLYSSLCCPHFLVVHKDNPPDHPSYCQGSTYLPVVMFLCISVDILANSSKLQEANPGFRSAEGNSLSLRGGDSSYTLMEAGESLGFTPRSDLSHPLSFTPFPTHSSWGRKERLLSRTLVRKGVHLSTAKQKQKQKLN